ncbi:MAG: Ger(x)C family spore germination protein [Clostridia bacterium]|nr:Ger(x)C family spore germination protein [Clostridia bacterium]
MKTKKLIAYLLIIIFCLPTLTGCYSAQGIETLAYAVAIGIDKGENDKIKLSLQFALLSNSSSGGGGTSSQSQDSTVSTVDCSSIDAGIALINSYISKKVNLSHCKAIVISEELAYEGISEYIYTLTNNIEVRPDCNVIISKCNASDYLNNSKPTLETVSARYYEFTLNSTEYTGYTENVTLADFYADMLSTTTQAHAILGGINSKNTQEEHSDLPLYDIEGSYTASQTPIQSATGIENMGIAVFNNDRLVGELTGMEALCHLIMLNEFESASITIPNPHNINSVTSLFITSNKAPKISVKLINGTPYIDCYISISGNILSLDENMNYSDGTTLQIIKDYTNSYMEENIISYLYKTSKEYNSDIDDFGKYVIGNYLTWNDWIESDWLSNYENAFFSVSVDTNIQTSQLFTKV